MTSETSSWAEVKEVESDFTSTPDTSFSASDGESTTKSDHQNGLGQHTLPIHRGLFYWLYTFWLLTISDIKAMVLPETACGIFGALSGAALTTNAHPDISAILWRFPQVLLWNWLNVLLFDLSNQRLPSAIIEDSVNKSWRPIPAGRLTATEARYLLLLVIVVVYVEASIIGGLHEAVVVMVLTWMHNDLRGGDESYIMRNLINAVAFPLYSAASVRIAMGSEHNLNDDAYKWFFIIAGVISTTLQTQDLYDMEGDAARGRRTLPLVFGENTARWSVAIPVCFWSLFCPAWWDVSLLAYAPTVVLGFTIAYRILMFRNYAADKNTWRLWGLWTVALYVLPLLARSGWLQESVQH